MLWFIITTFAICFCGTYATFHFELYATFVAIILCSCFLAFSPSAIQAFSGSDIPRHEVFIASLKHFQVTSSPLDLNFSLESKLICVTNKIGSACFSRPYHPSSPTACKNCKTTCTTHVRLPCGCTSRSCCVRHLLLDQHGPNSCPHCGKTLFKASPRWDYVHAKLMLLVVFFTAAVAISAGYQSWTSVYSYIFQRSSKQAVYALVALPVELAVLAVFTACCVDGKKGRGLWQVWWEYRQAIALITAIQLLVLIATLEMTVDDILGARQRAAEIERFFSEWDKAETTSSGSRWWDMIGRMSDA